MAAAACCTTCSAVADRAASAADVAAAAGGADGADGGARRCAHIPHICDATPLTDEAAAAFRVCQACCEQGRSDDAANYTVCIHKHILAWLL